jgi:hypothetical protein
MHTAEREKEPLTGFKHTNSAASEIRMHASQASQLANRSRYHALQFSESATFYDYAGYTIYIYIHQYKRHIYTLARGERRERRVLFIDL